MFQPFTPTVDANHMGHKSSDNQMFDCCIIGKYQHYLAVAHTLDACKDQMSGLPCIVVREVLKTMKGDQHCSDGMTLRSMVLLLSRIHTLGVAPWQNKTPVMEHAEHLLEIHCHFQKYVWILWCVAIQVSSCGVHGLCLCISHTHTSRVTQWVSVSCNDRHSTPSGLAFMDQVHIQRWPDVSG